MKLKSSRLLGILFAAASVINLTPGIAADSQLVDNNQASNKQKQSQIEQDKKKDNDVVRISSISGLTLR